MSSNQHRNVKMQPPFGDIAEATSKTLHAHVAAPSIHSLPNSSMLVIANSQPMGHFVAFTLYDLAVSDISGYEDELRSFRRNLRIGRFGCLFVTATIAREYCGDELAHYKNACNAQVLIPIPDQPPKSRLILGTMRLFLKEDTELYLQRHIKLDAMT